MSREDRTPEQQEYYYYGYEAGFEDGYDKAMYDIDIEEENSGMTIAQALSRFDKICRKSWTFAETLSKLSFTKFHGNEHWFLSREDLIAEDWQEFKHYEEPK